MVVIQQHIIFFFCFVCFVFVLNLFCFRLFFFSFCCFFVFVFYFELNGREEGIIFNTGATAPNTTNFNYDSCFEREEREEEVERKRIINICVYCLLIICVF